MSIITDLVSGAVKTGGGLLSGAASIFGGAKYWLIALAISNLATGVVFYEKGSDHVLTKTITTTIHANQGEVVAAVKAQAAQDAKDAAAAKQDYETRLAAAAKRNAALAALQKDLPLLVPHQEVCKIDAAVMDRLNDPKLIGEDAK